MSFYRAIFQKLWPLLLALSLGCENLPDKNPLVFENAAVCSAHPLASQVGVDILKSGGNAIDAAIATQFALSACLPNAGNIGGGGFCLLKRADEKARFLDFRELAPYESSKNMYLDSTGVAIPGLSTQGALSIAVPGTIDGLWKLHQEYGQLSWNELIQPSIEIANGYAMSSREVYLANSNATALEYENGIDFFLCRKDRPWAEGDTVKNPDLANTLVLLRDSGRQVFYSGSLGKILVQGISNKGGIISNKDLFEYESVWRDPLQFDYKDFKIITAPLPSSGGIGLLATLTMLEDFPLKSWGQNSFQTVHHVVEAEKLFYHQRAIELGDPDFFPLPENLSSKEFYRELRKKITSKAIQSSSLPVPETLPYESEETTHFSIIDKEGTMVSMTVTLNGPYGSKFAVPGTGFFLNNEMDDFSINPGVPNLYGLVGGEANSVAPRKRMLSSMTPTIIEKKGKPFMVLGSPGGSTIITTVLQVFLNVVEFDLSLKEAVDRPRYHHQWLPDSIQMEETFLTTEDSVALVRMGHGFIKRGGIGRVNALMVRKDMIEAGPDRRWDNTAVGY